MEKHPITNQDALRDFLNSLPPAEAETIKMQADPLTAAVNKADQINSEPWTTHADLVGHPDLVEEIDWGAPAATSHKSIPG